MALFHKRMAASGVTLHCCVHCPHSQASRHTGFKWPSGIILSICGVCSHLEHAQGFSSNNTPASRNACYLTSMALRLRSPSALLFQQLLQRIADTFRNLPAGFGMYLQNAHQPLRLQKVHGRNLCGWPVQQL